MKSLFEENSGTYTSVGDFLILDLMLEEQPEGRSVNRQDAVRVPEEMEKESVQ